ncbi:hypothetical protein DSAG12_01855 [Promethearchaeum syntrophicum]|uniref:Uncharacterized protein n=1 Tax=Promethearchaeum syntrophicum TaxID=2594042 RepID=A0A5B9DB18_9ARCH|nr:hypothetical protein [Candidatus Prometheoarchaeum syntrophicum]QEE16027.1 hypothetical protein DSAG12_01855 [Candidatus Prometheoarchaeum syntrophicum]
MRDYENWRNNSSIKVNYKTLPINSNNMVIDHVINRFKKSIKINKIILAASNHPEDYELKHNVKELDFLFSR